MGYIRNKAIPNTVAFITKPKFKDPFTGLWETNYFVPAVKYQLSYDSTVKNSIVVCCSPEWNGVWQYDKNLKKNFITWMNGKLECYYVPIKDCTKIKDLDEIQNPVMINEVKALQEAWYKGKIKNHPEYKKKRPEWFLK